MCIVDGIYEYKYTCSCIISLLYDSCCKLSLISATISDLLWNSSTHRFQCKYFPWVHLTLWLEQESIESVSAMTTYNYERHCFGNNIKYGAVDT